jgi:hypothetical protein
MAVRQVTAPNLSVPAWRGYCLMYVDDAGGAPKGANRQPNATAAYKVEKANGNIRNTADLPIGVWVPIFFSLPRYPQGDLGHVAWAFNHGNGWVEIHDSETQTGARPVYTSIAQVTAWFGAYGCTYLGYSYWVDGVHAIEDIPSGGNPAPNTGLVASKGTATVTVDVLNIRNDPSDDNAIIGTYVKGQKFNYDNYQINDGFVWLSYVSYSGVRRYVAQGPNDGNEDTNWVSGGV